ncbi:hypothetical protein GP2143_03198 [marine gamma proteobacterium HTCC2143]|uniref:Uncharacterized protein n=1 Tax=marine gamma proteobacterium HTCC2143 TaxID=247633 RepID=A0YCZ1_9GAMM|nr:hypothetical protein GP2143_03198 [marine gamma proteobacterium HTCC2143]
MKDRKSQRIKTGSLKSTRVKNIISLIEEIIKPVKSSRSFGRLRYGQNSNLVSHADIEINERASRDLFPNKSVLSCFILTKKAGVK